MGESKASVLIWFFAMFGNLIVKRSNKYELKEWQMKELFR
jgi:hypothetical protein